MIDLSSIDVSRWPHWISPGGEVLLVNADCLDVLPLLPKVDAVVTDPPYSEKTHKGARSSSDNGPKGGFVAIDFSSADVDFVRGVFSMCKPRRWLISFIDWHHCLPLENKPPDGIEFIRMGIWTKLNPMPQMTADRPGQGWESIAIFHPPGKKRWNRGSASAVWPHGTSRFGYFGASNHPTEKPLGLVIELIDSFSDAGNVILDPFAGSFTTAVACIQTGRQCIAIEKELKYFQIGKRRCEEALAVGSDSLFREVLTPTLFTEPQP